jgi:hypothetical protein
MVRHRHSRNRRVAVLAGGALSFSAATITMFGGLAYADDSGLVDGTPCSTGTRACVDLTGQKAWLIQDDKIVRGPISISSGGRGKETPAGSFQVIWKDKDHKSKEFPLKNGQPAPMPYSVFFEPGGIAFHGGSPERASAGCIHLNLADAIAFFNNLKIGDPVEVKARPGSGPVASTPGGESVSVDTADSNSKDSDDADGDDDDSGDDDGDGDDGDEGDDGDD